MILTTTMAIPKIYWVFILSSCLFMQCMASPLLTMPLKASDRSDLEPKQSPLSPSAFSLAATRFIVMLPFLPLMMAIPGVTAVIMPLFMAMQDRLKTIIPNLPNFMGGGGNSGNQQGGSITNSGISGIASNIVNALAANNIANNNNNNENSNTETPTFFRFKRSLLKRAFLKLPTKALNEGFREVFEFLYKTDDVINHLTSSQPDCRRQVVCRLHHSVDPTVGSFLGNMIQVFKLESQVEKLDVSDMAREIIKDVLKAANTGLYQRDCNSVYSRCSLSRKSFF